MEYLNQTHTVDLDEEELEDDDDDAEEDEVDQLPDSNENGNHCRSCSHDTLVILEYWYQTHIGDIDEEELIDDDAEDDQRCKVVVMALKLRSSWIKKFDKASRLADDINSMMSIKGSLPLPGPETDLIFTAIQTKIRTLETWLDSLQFLLPRTFIIFEKEKRRRKDMLANLRSNAKNMSSSFMTYHIEIYARASQQHIIAEENKTTTLRR